MHCNGGKVGITPPRTGVLPSLPQRWKSRRARCGVRCESERLRREQYRWPIRLASCAASCGRGSQAGDKFKLRHYPRQRGIWQVNATEPGFPQCGRAVGHDSGAKSSRWRGLLGNSQDCIAEKMRRAAESRRGRVPSLQPGRHIASAALSGPQHVLRDGLCRVRTSHGQHDMRNELAPTAVRGRTNAGATDGQCAAVIASARGQAPARHPRLLLERRRIP
jgi:hypothetical protein